MAELAGSTRGVFYTSPEVARKPQAGDLREEVGGSPAMGRGADLQSEIPHAKEPEARWRGGREYQEARLKALPTEVRARPHRTVYTGLRFVPPPSAGGQCPSQTRDHLFKRCPEWKMQQKMLWAEVQKETGRRNSRWTVRDLLADGRFGQAVLDFLSSTDVGRLVPPLGESDAASEVSEAGLQEWEDGQEAEELGAGEDHCSCPRLTSWHLQERSRGEGALFLCFSLLSFPL